MILILTDPTDIHADHLVRLLDRRGTRYHRLDPGAFPAQGRLSVGYGPDGLRTRRVTTPAGTLDLADVSAVWLRRPGRPVPDATLPAQVREMVAAETATVIGDVWDTVTVPWVPAPRPVVLRAQYRLRQLQVAGELGFELPATLVTNDPDALLDFAGEHGPLVTKQAGIAPLPGRPDGSPVLRYTEPLRPADLLAVEDIALCPLIVQAAVPKRVELRVTVVGDDVLSAAIHSQDTHHSRHDWRRYDHAHTGIAAHPLPDEVASRCRALTRALGLRYGAVDLILTPDDRYVFLEINPSGQYLWVELATGLPITQGLADLLSYPEGTR